jgi:hypothetical protein
MKALGLRQSSGNLQQANEIVPTLLDPEES